MFGQAMKGMMGAGGGAGQAMGLPNRMQQPSPGWGQMGGGMQGMGQQMASPFKGQAGSMFGNLRNFANQQAQMRGQMGPGQIGPPQGAGPGQIGPPPGMMGQGGPMSPSPEGFQQMMQRFKGMPQMQGNPFQAQTMGGSQFNPPQGGMY